MIVSYRHGFIFIKTAKTAGTSVELVLSEHCGPADILTPVAIDGERKRLEHGRHAQNFASPEIEREYLQAVRDGDREASAKVMQSLRRLGFFYNHMPASELKPRLDPAFWQSAFKFTIERHPYEKVVSKAYFRLWWTSQSVDGLSAMLDRIIAANDANDRPKYTINGQLALDHIFRQEEIDTAFPATLAHIGLPQPGELPRAFSDLRLDRRPAREILSEAQRRAIYAGCRETFETFGYEP